MTPDRVVVTGLGLVTPAGIGVAETWDCVRRAERTCAELQPDLADVPVAMACRVPAFDADVLLGRPTAWRLDRVSQLALVAAREAIEDAKLDPAQWEGPRVAVIVGNALGGAAAYEAAHETLRAEGPASVSPLVMVQWPVNMISGYLAMQCSALGPNMVVATACASGVTAVGLARQMLQAGLCDIAVTGGAEAPLTPTPMAAYSKMGALSRRTDDPSRASRPFDVSRDGFVAAEGAGILVLERETDARSRGAQARAVLGGFASTADGKHVSAPDPTGAGVERAIRQALAEADVDPADVDHVNAHGTSTQLNDLTEGSIIARVYDGPAVTSAKGVTGHSLGAAGAVETALTVLAVQHGIVPPTANLEQLDPAIDIDVVRDRPRHLHVNAAVNHSLGFGGQNAVLVVQSQ